MGSDLRRRKRLANSRVTADVVTVFLGDGVGGGGLGGAAEGGGKGRGKGSPAPSSLLTNNVLFVGNLPWSTTSDSLKATFAPYGVVSACLLYTYDAADE